MLRNVILICISLILTSCSLVQNDKAANRRAICKQLNHDIIFNGLTTNPIRAQEERASLDKLNQEYHEQDCP